MSEELSTERMRESLLFIKRIAKLRQSMTDAMNMASRPDCISLDVAFFILAELSKDEMENKDLSPGKPKLVGK